MFYKTLPILEAIISVLINVLHENRTGGLSTIFQNSYVLTSWAIRPDTSAATQHRVAVKRITSFDHNIRLWPLKGWVGGNEWAWVWAEWGWGDRDGRGETGRGSGGGQRGDGMGHARGGGAREAAGVGWDGREQVAHGERAQQRRGGIMGCARIRGSDDEAGPGVAARTRAGNGSAVGGGVARGFEGSGKAGTGVVAWTRAGDGSASWKWVARGFEAAWQARTWAGDGSVVGGGTRADLKAAARLGRAWWRGRGRADGSTVGGGMARGFEAAWWCGTRSGDGSTVLGGGTRADSKQRRGRDGSGRRGHGRAMGAQLGVGRARIRGSSEAGTGVAARMRAGDGSTFLGGVAWQWRESVPAPVPVPPAVFRLGACPALAWLAGRLPALGGVLNKLHPPRDGDGLQPERGWGKGRPGACAWDHPSHTPGKPWTLYSTPTSAMARWHPLRPPPLKRSPAETRLLAKIRRLPPKPQMRALHRIQVPYVREGDGWVYHCVEIVERGQTHCEIIAKVGETCRLDSRCNEYKRCEKGGRAHIWFWVFYVQRRQFAERMIHLALRAAGYQRAHFAKRCSCGRRHREFVKVGPNGSLEDIEDIIRRCLKEIDEGDAPHGEKWKKATSQALNRIGMLTVLFNNTWDNGSGASLLNNLKGYCVRKKNKARN
ncbi:hypothetical protein B0H14DRAFT_2637532 [Mycena olivaceomarginata]|nr:hypothetical protein B0H14DRAFT_2637532 [Mycena olivaceomarginata]